IGNKTALRVERLLGGSQEKFATGWHSLRGSMSELSLDSRVTTRLRWEKSLSDAPISVTAVGPAAGRLAGNVADGARKQRAAAGALSRLGVEAVENNLTVGAP